MYCKEVKRYANELICNACKTILEYQSSSEDLLTSTEPENPQGDLRDSIATFLTEIAMTDQSIAFRVVSECCERALEICLHAKQDVANMFHNFFKFENSFFLFSTMEIVLDKLMSNGKKITSNGKQN